MWSELWLCRFPCLSRHFNTPMTEWIQLCGESPASTQDVCRAVFNAVVRPCRRQNELQFFVFYFRTGKKIKTETPWHRTTSKIVFKNRTRVHAKTIISLDEPISPTPDDTRRTHGLDEGRRALKNTGRATIDQPIRHEQPAARSDTAAAAPPPPLPPTPLRTDRG